MPTDQPGVAFRRAAQILRDADKAVMREVRSELRKIAAPLSERIISKGAPHVPQRGGLRARIQAARASQSNTFNDKGGSIALRWPKPRVLRYIDRGLIPHPVYPDASKPRATWTWTVQHMKAGVFTDAFLGDKDEYADQLLTAVQRAAARIAADLEKGNP